MKTIKIIDEFDILSRFQEYYDDFINNKRDLAINITADGYDTIIEYIFNYDYDEILLKIVLLIEPYNKTISIDVEEEINNYNSYPVDCERQILIQTTVIINNHDWVKKLLDILEQEKIDWVVNSGSFYIEKNERR